MLIVIYMSGTTTVLTIYGINSNNKDNKPWAQGSFLKWIVNGGRFLEDVAQSHSST